MVSYRDELIDASVKMDDLLKSDRYEWGSHDLRRGCHQMWHARKKHTEYVSWF